MNVGCESQHTPVAFLCEQQQPNASAVEPRNTPITEFRRYFSVLIWYSVKIYWQMAIRQLRR